MSRRKKPKSHKIELKQGRFYNVHDGSIKGHPGRIEIIDHENNTFLSVTTGSMTKEEYSTKRGRKDYKELKHPTSSDVYRSFVNKRPFKGIRDDYGDKEFENMEFHKDDLPLVNSVKTKNPRLGY